ncbi:MAG: beta-propeller fold lactonase family protein, partial [Alphaproteobacteria bacterium]|nr:beta-propeller fold lactonase family protein [Alphaproteobacteria bacterium]
LLALRRDQGSITMLRNVSSDGNLTGMTLSPDGHFLAAATGTGVAIFDIAKLTAGAPSPIVASSDDGPHPGSIYAAFSPDGSLLFVANERSASLSVYDASGLPAGLGKVGRIMVGVAPVGLAISPNGKYLYSTSEVGPQNWPSKCTSEGPPHPEGLLLVIDVAKAASDPAHATLGGASAGCNPVRVALSADGRTLYVTARGDNTLVRFDAAELISDTAHARPARIPVGMSPVGVIAIGNKVIVANSNRFGGGNHESLSVLNASDLISRPFSIPAGSFPRELSVTPDKNTLVVTNFASGDLELIDLRRLEQAVH